MHLDVSLIHQDQVCMMYVYSIKVLAVLCVSVEVGTGFVDVITYEFFFTM